MYFSQILMIVLFKFFYIIYIMCQIAHFLSYLGEAVVFPEQYIWPTEDKKLRSPRKALFVWCLFHKTTISEKFLLSGITVEIVM